MIDFNEDEPSTYHIEINPTEMLRYMNVLMAVFWLKYVKGLSTQLLFRESSIKWQSISYTIIQRNVIFDSEQMWTGFLYKYVQVLE